MLVIGAGEHVLRTKHLPEGFGRGEHLTLGAAAGARTEPLAPAPSLHAIRSALDRHSQHRGRAAADLALSRHQLYRLIKRYGLDLPPSDQ
jgi:transcriptional regulator with PAS, ATPase and Fis domain